MTHHCPPPSVLAAFGAAGPARRLPGGQGTSWLVDGLVLKPGSDHELQQWVARVLAGVPQVGFRTAAPVPTRGGAWVHEGWSAATWIPGDAPDRSTTAGWLAVLNAGRALHRATAALPRPVFLADRHDPWAIADRMTWGGEPLRTTTALTHHVDRLQAVLEPLGPSQLVHGDLTTNVLTAAGRPPAIIDISPYWRPPAYADGIVIADALLWHTALGSLATATGVPRAAAARGLLFRALTDDLRAGTKPVDVPVLQRYDAALAELQVP